MSMCYLFKQTTHTLYYTYIVIFYNEIKFSCKKKNDFSFILLT
jgi:hypothetical protein